MASEKTSYRFQALPSEVVKDLREEHDRATRATMRLVSKWPNYRREIAVELLGAATATAETFGVDAVAPALLAAVAELARLRAREAEWVRTAPKCLFGNDGTECLKPATRTDENCEMICDDDSHGCFFGNGKVDNLGESYDLPHAALIRTAGKL